jgi:hypothetical protein
MLSDNVFSRTYMMGSTYKIPLHKLFLFTQDEDCCICFKVLILDLSFLTHCYKEEDGT